MKCDVCEKDSANEDYIVLNWLHPDRLTPTQYYLDHPERYCKPCFDALVVRQGFKIERLALSGDAFLVGVPNRRWLITNVPSGNIIINTYIIPVLTHVEY